MSDQTGIEWTDATWNPIRGCSRVSAGCMHCYAERQAIRQIKSGYAGLIQRTSHGPAWTGEVRLVPELLDAPLRWRSPRRVFVNSMSDLFHERLPDEAILQVFDVMRQCANGWTGEIGGEHGKLVAAHTFQILTKRPARMLDFCSRLRFAQNDARGMYLADQLSHNGFNPMPALRNVWLGVSVEDQATADERIPLLLQTSAAVRFVSYEPALGPVDFSFGMPWRKSGPALNVGINWLIVGGESGPGARPCDVAWIRRAVEQCKRAGVPCFVKQLGARPRGWCAARLMIDECDYEDGMCDFHEALEGMHCGDRCAALDDRKGGDPAEWPADLRVREMPR